LRGFDEVGLPLLSAAKFESQCMLQGFKRRRNNQSSVELQIYTDKRR